MNGLLGILGQVVVLDVVLILRTVWIIWIDLVAWLYWSLIVWSDGHGAVLQVNEVALDIVAVSVEDNVLAIGTV